MQHNNSVLRISPNWLLGLLLPTAFLAYVPGFTGPFLFDDFAALSANRLLQLDPAVFDQWRTAAFSSNSGPLGRPIAMFTFALNYVAAGEVSAYWIKLVNAVIHVATGAALYALALRVFGRLPGEGYRRRARWLALLTAAIWLLHPLHVSTVLYSVQRMAQLATLFTCLGLLLFTWYRERWARHGADAGELLAASLWLLLLTALAAYSKENGALLAPLVLVVEVALYRGQWAGRRVPWLYRIPAAALVLFFSLIVAVAIAPPDFLEGRYLRREFSLHERVLTQARLLWHYLYWLAVPDISAMAFQHDDIPTSRGILRPPATLLAVLAWPAAILGAIALRRRYPLLLFSLLFYLVGHSLESTVWPLEMVYEHRNYLPSMGVCMLFAAILAAPFSLGSNGRLAGSMLVTLVPVLLAGLLLVRVDTWSDELQLAGVNVHNHPGSSRSNYFYANALLKRYQSAGEAGVSEEEGRRALAAARYYFERMYETNPRDVAALVMLHSLDTQFFRDMPGRRDWLAELDALLQDRPLQASDFNALEALIDCVNRGGCAADEERVLALLDRLDARYPRNLKVIGLRFNYLLAHDGSEAQLAALIDRALEIVPGRREYLYRRIQQQAARNDVGGMYESARRWLQHDDRRIYLHALKGMFSTPDASGED